MCPFLASNTNQIKSNTRMLCDTHMFRQNTTGEELDAI